MATEQRDGYSNFDRESLMRDLEEKGFVVIPEVCSARDCDTYVSQYFDWLSQFGNERPNRSNSVIKGYNIGHFENTWQARLKAKPVFVMLWQTKKLLTSIDRVAISYPPETEENGEFVTGTNWLHFDHSSNRLGLHAYQGALYLEEASESDHCFRVLQGSHRYLQDFYDKFKDAAEKSIGYLRFQPDVPPESRRPRGFHLEAEHLMWFKEKGCVLKKVRVPKGGMVLWDTRTAHDNCKPERGRPTSDRWRFVVFVCMAPARWARDEDMKIKKKVYRNLVMTGHSACQEIHVLNDITPEHAKKIVFLSKLPELALTQEVRLLCGDLEYDFNDGQPNGPDWTPVWQ